MVRSVPVKAKWNINVPLGHYLCERYESSCVDNAHNDIMCLHSSTLKRIEGTQNAMAASVAEAHRSMTRVSDLLP